MKVEEIKKEKIAFLEPNVGSLGYAFDHLTGGENERMAEMWRFQSGSKRGSDEREDIGTVVAGLYWLWYWEFPLPRPSILTLASTSYRDHGRLN